MNLQRTLNALLALVLMGILVSAYYQQYIRHEEPCPLCLLQRLGIIGVATGALFNLRFEIHPLHYGFSLLAAISGGAVSIRQTLLHICPGSPIFGYPVFGINLYTWAFLTFASSVLTIILLLFLYTPQNKEKKKMNWLEYLAFTAVILLTCANFITTFRECSFGVCPDFPWP